jgi:hypothetical protein
MGTRQGTFTKGKVPTKTVRWTLPEQLVLDMNLVGRVTGWYEGELATAFIIHCLRYLVPQWNERHDVKIPDLPSLVSPGTKRPPFTIRELMDEVSRTMG